MSSLKFIHFNDVYHVAPRATEPKAGAARFVQKIRDLQSHAAPDQVPVLFSGDVFNPSTLSSITRGHHMVPVINRIVDVACVGNHDLDFGCETSLFRTCTFPWLLTNVSQATGEPLVDCSIRSLAKTYNGVRVGIVGLVEQDWIETLPNTSCELSYEDFVTAGHRYAVRLRAEGCTLIVALTHMRMHNDRRLAMEVPEIDLVLGGHDHFYMEERIGDTLVLKSGSDFRDLSVVTVSLDPTTHRRTGVTVERHTITGDLAEEPETKAEVDALSADLNEMLKLEIGATQVALDGRVSVVRTAESTWGNLVADVMLGAYNCDVAFLCGGSIRGDSVVEPGTVTVGDVMDAFPFEDTCVVVEISGARFRAALENGVSRYPAHEGRFPQVSQGVRVVFDGARRAGERLLSVTLNGREIKDTDTLRCCTRHYLQQGNDGYTMLKDLKLVIDDEQGALLSTLLRNFFRQVEAVDAFDSATRPQRRALARWMGKPWANSRFRAIAPRIEGRIVNVNVEKK